MLTGDSHNPETQTYTAVAPSNIAMVKYWGKRDALLQWPANDSISMTLSKCCSITTTGRSTKNFDTFEFSNTIVTSVDQPEHKVFRHLNRLREFLGTTGHLKVSSRNTFPSDCGIASSASGFAALTLSAAASLAQTARWDELSTRGLPRSALAHLAKLGSGSACRSLYGGFVQWTAGASAHEQKTEEIFPENHWNLADVIVIVSSSSKPVSSREAHKGAWGSPLFAPRIAGLDNRIKSIKSAILARDIEALGREMEYDALEMHAVSMTGSPGVNYLTETTVRFISWVRNERNRGKFPAWFTIDAGPNVHVICRHEDVNDVITAIKKEWGELSLIVDQIGSGPSLSVGRGGLADV